MADAILVPYLHTEDVISTEKKEVFTLENFDLTASCTAGSSIYAIGGWDSSGGSRTGRLFNGSPSITVSEYPTVWLQSIANILGNNLFDVSKCVINITSKLKEKSGLSNSGNATTAIGIRFTTSDDASYPYYNNFESLYKFTVKFDKSGNPLSADTVSSSISLLDIKSASLWKNKSIKMDLVSGSPSSGSWIYWTNMDHSITISIVKAECTIIFTDYR